MRFLEAKNYRKGRSQKVRVIVVHTMEAPKSKGRAMACASYFAAPNSPKVSAHYSVDNAEVVQSVRDEDTAWHALDANPYSIGIEHAGYAKQSPAEWDDDYNRRMLALSAGLVRGLCSKYGIPVVRLTPDELRAGKSGIVGHLDVTKAYGHKGGHTDPGQNFPWDKYLSLVRSGDPVAGGGGAVLGATAGLVAGGPVGAAVGAVLGYVSGKRLRPVAPKTA